jgi:DNA transposition AAA+ family ATPase
METKARQIQRHLDSIRSNHNQTMSKRKYNENDFDDDDDIDYDNDKAVRKIKRQNSKNLLKKWQDAEDEYDDDFYSR